MSDLPPLGQRVTTKLRRLRSKAARVGGGTGIERYLFIVTYGRTGSTLLQKVLNRLPGTYIAGENHNALYGVFDAWRNACTLKAKYGWGYQTDGHPWHGSLAADPDGYARAMLAAFIAHILKPPRGATTVGFKEIRYLIPDLREYLLFLDRFLAPAVFVINTRAVDEVAKSAWWKLADKGKLAADIARFEAITSELVEACPDRFVKIDYAAWSTNPEALRPVFKMLDAPFDAAAIGAVLDIRLEHMRG